MSTNSTICQVINNQQINSLKQKIFYYVTVAFLPNIFLFNLYNNNRDAQIILQHVLFLGVILATISVVMLWAIRLMVRTYEGALLLLLIFWIAFWFFEAIHAILPYRILNLLPISSRILLFAGIIGVIIGVSTFLRFHGNRFYKRRVVFNVLSSVICLLFIFNVFPSFVYAINTSLGGAFYIRREFNVDSSLPSPDIYWFHMDGMISLNAVEYYFDTSQSETRERLLELGFVVNENAEFGAGGTIFGVSALLSPNFYDSYLHGIFRWDLLRRDRRHEIHSEAIEADGISFPNDIAPYHELFHAFLQAGYTSTTIASFSPYTYSLINQFYRLGESGSIDEFPFAITEQPLERHFLIDSIDLIELLVMTTLVPNRFANIVSGEIDIEWQTIPTHADEIDKLTASSHNLTHERQLYRALINHLEISQPDIPTLTYITTVFTHANRWIWQDDSSTNSDPSRIDLYPLAHEYALYVMFNMIDLILERNTDAVIVIQADHGMHLLYTQQALLNDGFTEEEVLSLYNSVISAVRIPEQYGGLDAPLDPLNITRELVNRFVGDNYQLLDQ